MNVFYSIEAFITLELRHAPIMINIQLISSKYGHGGHVVKAKCECIFPTLIDGNPVPIKQYGGGLSKLLFIFINKQQNREQAYCSLKFLIMCLTAFAYGVCIEKLDKEQNYLPDKSHKA